MYSATARNDITYSVTFVEYPKEYFDWYTPEQILDAGAERLLKARPEGRHAKSNIRLQGYPARAVFLDDPATHYNSIIRSRLANRRLYVVQAIKPDTLKDNGEVDRFLALFKIDPPQPVQTNSTAKR